jgi:hypothetical protein
MLNLQSNLGKRQQSPHRNKQPLTKTLQNSANKQPIKTAPALVESIYKGG